MVVFLVCVVLHNYMVALWLHTHGLSALYVCISVWPSRCFGCYALISAHGPRALFSVSASTRSSVVGPSSTLSASPSSDPSS